MKKYAVRSAEAGDSQNYFEWLKAASDRNLVDTGVYEYPTCNTVVVEADGEPELMNSFHLVVVMEALAPKPGIAARDEARALLALYEGIRNMAQATGVREILFTCKDETLEPFILRKGWEKVNTPVFRMKVGSAGDPCAVERPKGKNQ